MAVAMTTWLRRAARLSNFNESQFIANLHWCCAAPAVDECPDSSARKHVPSMKSDHRAEPRQTLRTWMVIKPYATACSFARSGSRHWRTLTIRWAKSKGSNWHYSIYQ
jgi:hypothetical protein